MIFGRIYEKIVNSSINRDISLLEIEENVKKTRKFSNDLKLTKSKTNLVHSRGNVFPYKSYDIEHVNKSIDQFITL